MKKHKNQTIDRGVKKLVLLVSALFLMIGFCTGLSAQSTGQGNYATLKGVVLEKGTTNTPVEFATVQVLPQGSVVTTSSKGEFAFERLSPGKVNVKIQFLGMEGIDTTFNLVSGGVTQLTFYMRYSSFRLNDVTVVATESKAGQATASNISRQAMPTHTI